MNKPVFIIGAGGLGREVLAMLRAIPEWQVVGFLDDLVPAGTVVNGIPVKGGVEFLNNYPEFIHVVVAIGDPLTKEKIVSRISNNHIHFPTIIHPRAILQDPSSIITGKGGIICAGVVLTTNIVIGDFALVNLNTTVGHDSSVGSFSSIMPGVNLAGNVTISRGVLVGSGANIRNKVRIGKHAVVGMGSVVLQNVEDETRVAGVPAKLLRS